ncbi:MAG: CAAX protease [Cyanobacteria bacterium J06560_6]
MSLLATLCDLSFSLPTLLATVEGGQLESPSVLLTVLLAGLSISVGQSIILFINRVKPGRFVLSLVIQALLFVSGFFFISFSTWFVSRIFFKVSLPYTAVSDVIGLGYGPLKWSFLSALPYLGNPIFVVLSLGSLLAILKSFALTSSLTLFQSFLCVVWGWGLLRAAQQTIGHPLTLAGERLLHWAAGQRLVRDHQSLAKIITAGPTLPVKAVAISQQTQTIGSPVRSSVSQPPVPIENETDNATTPAQPEQATASALRKPSSPLLKTKQARLASLLGLAITVCLAVVLLANFQKLIAIALILFILAALIAPMEALGWWAGWFGDGIDTTQRPGVLLEAPSEKQASRYVVYLDGIGQSRYEYQPAVANFLQELAKTLPNDIVLISGFMPYSILNLPLEQDRILGFFWRWVEQRIRNNPASKLGALVNIQNVLTVAVAADQRYGPIYNQGMAQLIYNSLVEHGYHPGSRTPVTLIGYSGGGEMSMGALPFLKQALNTSIEVISLGGVISGNIRAIALEHLYHLVGDKDIVERVGPIFFPRRWKLFFLSYWNRAKRRGQISLISLGPVGHQVPGGIMDPNHKLPDGRSSLQQTLSLVSGILTGELRIRQEDLRIHESSYERYSAAIYNQPQHYPLTQTVSPERYQPIASWMGRLILPSPNQRQSAQGTFFEVHNAPAEHQHLVGQTVTLRQAHDSDSQELVQAVTRDVHFSDDAEYSSRKNGLIHPTRLNHWRQVTPLESLAGARPKDDMIVMLHEPVAISTGSDQTILQVDREPVQISGRYYGLVTIQGPVAHQKDCFQVAHFNRQSGQFDGPQEIVQLPEVLPDDNGTLPATNQDIKKSPLNPSGWYIYGAKSFTGLFVVQALAPRKLFQLQPSTVITDQKAALQYLKKENWQTIESQKGSIQSVLISSQLSPESSIDDIEQRWQEGDRALLLHVYGGIGGKNKEPAAQGPFYFGHFSYGNAIVIREPLTGELRFEVEYHQVYTHNVRGLISGNMHWSKYMGDRQWGFLGTRPVCDLLVKLDAFTQDFDFEGTPDSALRGTISQLEAMMARYRIGDGTGGTYVGPANNCAQDSNQSLYAALRRMETLFETHHDWLKQWQQTQPEQVQRFQQLINLKQSLKRKLMPFGSARADWREGAYNLGSSLEDRPLHNLSIGIGSWRTLLPRLASDTIVKIFLEQNADVWVLSTHQVGGHDPDIAPLAPMTL